MVRAAFAGPPIEHTRAGVAYHIWQKRSALAAENYCFRQGRNPEGIYRLLHCASAQMFWPHRISNILGSHLDLGLDLSPQTPSNPPRIDVSIFAFR
jgi:hypothetical protein